MFDAAVNLLPSCCCGACADDGCFVYAHKESSGWISPHWSSYPAKVTKLYRQRVTTLTVDWYYPDFVDDITAIYWRTTVYTETLWIHPIHNQVYKRQIVGSDQGVILDWEWDFNACAYGIYFAISADALVQVLDPYSVAIGSPTYYVLDAPALTDIIGTLTAGSALCPFPPDDGSPAQILSASEGQLTWRWTSASLPNVNSGGGPNALRVTVAIAMGDAFTPDSIGLEATAMLASIPLTIPNQLLTNAVDNLGFATPAWFGFARTAGSPYGGNRIEIGYVPEVCGGFYKNVFQQKWLGSVGPHEDTCACCSLTRIEAYHPAARTGSKFVISGGFSVGVAYGISDAPSVSSMPVCIPSSPFTAQGYAKKALLDRVLPDWITVFVPYDPFTDTYDEPAGVALACDTKKCHRYYYPSGGDGKTEDGTSAVFTFTGDGIIYRAIPIDLLAPLGGDCPTGLLPWTGEICP